MLFSHQEACGLCHARYCIHVESKATKEIEEFIAENAGADSMSRTLAILKKNGFEVLDWDNGKSERGFPSVTIAISNEDLVGWSRRLCDLLRRHTVIVTEHSDRVWQPQIHVVYDPSANKAFMYLYGVSDEIIPDL